MFLIILLNVLFSLTFIIAKEVLQFSKPFFFVGFRMIIAGTVLLIYHYFLYKRFEFKKSDLKLYFQLSLFHIFIPYIFEYYALQYISAAKTSLIFNLSPFVTAILVYFFSQAKLTKQKLIGLIIGFLGFIPLLVGHGQDEVLTKEILFISLPELMVIFAVVSSALAWIIIQKHSKNMSFSFLNGVAMLGGGIMSLITSLMVEGVKSSPIFNLKYFLLLTFAIIILGNFICYNLYGYLLKRYSATFLSFAGFMIPIFTAIFQYLFFGTIITSNFILTALIVFIGLFLFYKDELKFLNRI